MDLPESYVAFDFETTGLDPARDRIVRVGLCQVADGEILRQTAWLVNQDIDIPEGATAIHGITAEDVRSRGEAPERSLRLLLEVLGSAPQCIGHDIHRCDVAFLQAECERFGRAAPNVESYVDTAALYKGWKLNQPKHAAESHRCYAQRVLAIRAPGVGHALGTCLSDLGIVVDPREFCDTSADAYAAHLLYGTLAARL